MEEVKKKKDFLLIKLFIGIVLGIIIGNYANEALINVIQSAKYIFNQIIAFMIPLIVLGFIAPAITDVGQGASKMLGTLFLIAYLSSLFAALLSMTLGYAIIPHFNIPTSVEALRKLPEIVFKLDIAPIFPVISALFLAVFLGLAVVKTKSTYFTGLFSELNNIMLFLVNNVVVPILPFYIGTTFATLSYEGTIIKRVPVFLIVILMAIIIHIVWISILYIIGGILNKVNPFKVLRHYGPAYMTAVGTMSSAATLPVALKCAGKSNVLHRDVINFAIPMCSTIHLCGSVITESFFVMTVSKMLYGTLPSLPTMILFIILLCVFAVGAPGVPGGTVVASLGIIASILGFDQDGLALVVAIYALQDSFGTACNITADGALALILQGVFKKDFQNI